MNISYFRFYEELNDFIPKDKRKRIFPFQFKGNPSVKDAIEAIGVPHVEVDMILLNGKSVDFSHELKNEDFVSVYPVFESLNISSVTHLREKPLRDIKFVADVHLGKLTRYLRLCGFDTYYRPDLTDNEIIGISISEKRAILTRDRIMLKNRKVTHGYWIRSQDSRIQLKEVINRFDLGKMMNLFTRCMECNGMLENIEKIKIADRLLPMTRRYYRKFMICNDCNRIYWNGSHYRNMKKMILREIRS